jgi:hypothetical protein
MAHALDAPKCWHDRSLMSDVKDRAAKSNSGISWTRERTVLGKLCHDKSGFRVESLKFSMLSVELCTKILAGYLQYKLSTSAKGLQHAALTPQNCAVTNACELTPSYAIPLPTMVEPNKTSIR